VSNLAWLMVGLAIVFATIGGYSASLLVRAARLRGQLQELERPRETTS